MAKHYVWVHTAGEYFEYESVTSAYSSLTRAKKMIGGEWVQVETREYLQTVGNYSFNRLTKVEIQ